MTPSGGGGRTVNLALSALFAALTAIFAQVKFNLGPVPYTMQNFAIMTAALLLRPKYAALSQLLYLLLIGFSLPAGAGLRGGPGVLVGYTAGYLWMFPVTSYLMSRLSRMRLGRSMEGLVHLSAKELACLLALSFIAALPMYLLGFLVFSYYALQPTLTGRGLAAWVDRVTRCLGTAPLGRWFGLFTASVLIFIPQDLFVDHLLAIVIASKVLRFTKNLGLPS